MTDENQKANQIDLVITMENQLPDPPRTGAMVNIIGVFTGYQLNPFFLAWRREGLQQNRQKTEGVPAPVDFTGDGFYFLR